MKIVIRFLIGVSIVAMSACGGGGGGGGDDDEFCFISACDPVNPPDLSGPWPASNNVTIVGVPICDDFGGTGDFGCRIVPPGAPPDIGLTISDKTESILVDIEIDNMQRIELIDSDGILERITVVIFVTNNAAVNVSVSMTIELTDENGSVIDSFGTVPANVFPFTPGFSGLVAFTADLDIQTLTPVIYHGVRLNVTSTGGPVTFGNFVQVNIFEVDQTSTVAG